MNEPTKKPTPQPEPPPPLEGLPDAPDWMLWFATGCIILGVVILIAMLAGCAPPPPTGDAVLDVDLRNAVVPTTLWQGADHPEWASCSTVPPSAICTEP